MTMFHDRLKAAIATKSATDDVWTAAKMILQIKEMMRLHDDAGQHLAMMMQEHWKRAGEPTLNAHHIEKDHGPVAAQAFSYWLLMEFIREKIQMPNGPH